MFQWQLSDPTFAGREEVRQQLLGCGRRLKGYEILLRAEPISQAGMAELADAADSKSSQDTI